MRLCCEFRGLVSSSWACTYCPKQYFSPRQLLLQESLEYERHCKYCFGQYVQAHDDETRPRNSQQSRTLDALYIRTVASGQEVYNLATDEIITRVKITPLPIPQHVIDTVNRIAARQHQPGLKIQARNGDVLYNSTWTSGVDYESDDEDDEDYDPDEEDFDSEAEDSDLEDDCSTTDDESCSDDSQESEESQESED